MKRTTTNLPALTSPKFSTWDGCGVNAEDRGRWNTQNGFVEYSNKVLSTTIKSTPDDIPPLNFEFDADLWQGTANRITTRRLSQEKQEASSTVIDELLSFGVVRPSKATAWSQVMLVSKGEGKFRLIIDYHQLNKAVKNKWLVIPNMNQMLPRIGSKKPKLFWSADLIHG